MKKLNFVVVFAFSINLLSFGQNIEKFQKIKIIEWDYLTSTYVNDIILQKLRVNDIVRVKLINLPKSCKLTSTATFLNNHLESKNDFGSQIKFDKNSDYLIAPSTINIENKTKDILQKSNQKLEQNNDETAKLFIDSTPDALKADKKLYNDLLSRNPRINYTTIVKDLEIGNVDNFIYNLKGNEKVKIDLKWQKNLINIAQKNWRSQLILRDSLLSTYSKQIDKLNSKIVAQSSEIDSLSLRNRYYTTPLKIENYDYTTFNFTISELQGNKETTLNIPFKNYCGLKVDFSTGVLVNGLFSPTYILKADKLDSSQKQIVEEENGSSRINTGICLMAHAYPRIGEFLNFGIGSGFNYNLNQQNLNFLLGGSFLLGSEQRFIATSGVCIGKVKELSKTYELEKSYSNTVFSTDTTVPTVEVLKASWFISITYNLGIGNPSKTKKI